MEEVVANFLDTGINLIGLKKSASIPVFREELKYSARGALSTLLLVIMFVATFREVPSNCRVLRPY